MAALNIQLPPLTEAEKAACKSIVAQAQSYLKSELTTLDNDAIAKLGFFGSLVGGFLTAFVSTIDAKIDQYAAAADAAIDAA